MGCGWLRLAMVEDIFSGGRPSSLFVIGVVFLGHLLLAVVVPVYCRWELVVVGAAAWREVN